MTSHQQTDEQLVAAAISGDQAAIGQLYDRYIEYLYRWVYRKVGHREEAEDLTSEIMLRMVKQLPRYTGTSAFRTWLIGIGNYVVADFWRTKYKLHTSPAGDWRGFEPAAPADPEQDDGTVDIGRARAEKVFDQLPPHYRQVLECRFFEQRTLAETAVMMETTVENIKVMQHRALKKAASLAKEFV